MTGALVYNDDFIRSYKGRWTGLVLSAVDGTSFLFDEDYASKEKCQEDIDELLLDPVLRWDCGKGFLTSRILFIIPLPCISL